MKSSSLPKKASAAGFVLGLIVKCILWLLACGGIALLITCVLMVWLGQEEGLLYLQNLVHTQIDWINSHGFNIAWGHSLLYSAIYDVRTIQNTTANFATIAHCGATQRYAPLRHIAAVICPFIAAYGSALIMATQLTILRIATALLFVPIFIMLGSIGIIDGFIHRHLRRLQGGRESALIYHHARNAILPTLFLTSFLYVVLPISIKPAYVFVPGAIMFAALIYFACKTFKKYL